MRIGGAHAERRGKRPAQGTGLSGIDPVTRTVDAEELRAGDLRQPDDADIAGIAPERLAHLLIDALRLDRHVVEMTLAQHRAFAILARRRPRLALLQSAGFPPFLRNHDE